MDFGNLLSPMLAGQAMDRYGRKRTLVFSAFVYVVCSVLVLFARTATHLFAARLLAGIGKGFAFTVTPIYVAEISSKNIRGTLSSYFYTFFCVGTVVATAVGPYVSFQTYNLISLSLPVFFLVMTVPMPESPYYYVMTNQHDKARKALHWYRDTSTKHKQVRPSPTPTPTLRTKLSQPNLSLRLDYEYNRTCHIRGVSKVGNSRQPSTSVPAFV